VLRIDRQHQAVEKTPAIGRGPCKQTVHRGDEPQHAQMIGKSAGGRYRSIDLDRRTLAWSHTGEVMPVRSQLERASTSAATAHVPSPSLKATSSSVAWRVRDPASKTKSLPEYWSFRTVRTNQHNCGV
jgi:hypothetical protein